MIQFFVFPHLKDIPFDLSDVTDDIDVTDVPDVMFVNIVSTPAEFFKMLSMVLLDSIDVRQLK